MEGMKIAIVIFFFFYFSAIALAGGIVIKRLIDWEDDLNKRKKSRKAREDAEV